MLGAKAPALSPGQRTVRATATATATSSRGTPYFLRLLLFSSLANSSCNTNKLLPWTVCIRPVTERDKPKQNYLGESKLDHSLFLADKNQSLPRNPLAAHTLRR